MAAPQLAVVPEAAPDESGEPVEQPGAPSGLNLTDVQYERVLQRALQRIDELRSDMGIDSHGQTVGNGWAWKRECNQLQYDNSWEWRKALGGIFMYSNFSLNISKRYARLMAAKTSDTLVGTDPFFAAMPTEHGNPDLAKQAEWYVQDEMAQTNTKKGIKGAQKIALIRNEAVVKLSWVSEQTHFRGPVEVAVGPFRYETPAGSQIFGAGDPIITPKGDYIYPDDDTFEDPNVKGLLHLEKEPSVSFRHSFDYKYFDDLDQSLPGQEGLDVRTVDYRDFLCPLKAATIHEADINAHLFDEEWGRLRAKYRGFAISDKYFAETRPNPTQAPHSGEKAPKVEKGEMEEGSQLIPWVHCADVYMRCNPYEGDEDQDLGLESEIWLVIDVVNKKIIWADYLGNHMNKRPFEVIPGVELVEGRWYGVGVFEMLDHKQLYVDTQFNRVNWKSSKSSSVRFRNKNAVAQWRAGEKLVIGDNKILDVEDPRFDSKNPPLFQVNLTEVDEYAMKLIELMIQAGSTEVGIVGPDDAGLAGLDTGKLATGIKSLERTGNLLMKFTESDHAEAITAILDQAVDIILEHMDESTIAYKPDTNQLLNLNRQEIRKMKKSVKLLLTKSRSTETIETARMVIQLCREYYEALNPYERYKLRSEYIRQLKALETPDADAKLDEVTKEEAYAWLEQSKQPPTVPPKTSIATKYPDLERSEQVQVLQREGIQPATDQEVATSQAKDANLKIATEGAVAKAKEDAKPTPPKPAAGKK